MGATLKHELKIWPQYYTRVSDGSKTFEVRLDDRGFQTGDEVILKEWDPTPTNPADPDNTPKGFTDSDPLHFKIGYILVMDYDSRAKAPLVVFSLLPMPKNKK